MVMPLCWKSEAGNVKAGPDSIIISQHLLLGDDEWIRESGSRAERLSSAVADVIHSWLSQNAPESG